MPPAPPPPQHGPTQRELDDLELLLHGALAPTVGFNEPDSPVTLDLPRDLEESAAAAGAVELVDPEGLPLARTPWPTGPPVPLSRPEHGPFRRLHLSPDDLQRRHVGRTLVPVAEPLTTDQLERLRDAGPLVLLALTGHGRARPSGPGLIRATLAGARQLPDAVVVAAPVADHADPDLCERAVAAYAGSLPVLPLPPGREAPPREVAAVAGAEDEPGVVLFFTGLSGSGKSTLARALMDQVLERTTRDITSLDGDVVRRHLSKGLTFSREDRETNIRRIGWVAAEIARHGGLAVCSPIAPFDETRRAVRAMVEEAGGRFFLVHVATPLAECERRDRKGLYARARAGEIPDFTGISSPYEEPADPDVRIDTTGRSIEDALEDVTAALTEGGLLDLPAPGESDGAARPLHILFVCTANICRSPYMELATRRLLRDPGAAVVASAGTHGFADSPIDEAIAGAMADRGIDHSSFRSRVVTRRMVDDADVVLTAEAAHRSFLLEEQPAAFRKVFTLAQLAAFIRRGTGATGRDLVVEAGRSRGSASPDLDVSDPYRRGDAAAEATARHIDELLAVVIPALTPSPRPTSTN